MFENSRTLWNAEDRIRHGDVELHDNIVGNFHRDASWRWIVTAVQDSTFTVLNQDGETLTIEKSRLQEHDDWAWDGKRAPRQIEEPDPNNYFDF